VRISAIVPLYNTRAYIVEAIDSILAQTRPADDIVVVDDGSTDGGADLLARYGTRLRVVRQEHAGPATALNRGIAETTGDVIAFLDADDLWARDKLALQAPVLAADPDLDAVFGLVQQFGQGVEWANIPQEPQRGVSRIGLLMRRSAFERFGLFDASLRVVEFVPWYARATALGLRSEMLERVVACRRIHDSNSSIVRRDQQQQESLLGLKQALELRRRRGAASPDQADRTTPQD
jgi:glycosyltransferase involved in cell wall biosynthesis